MDQHVLNPEDFLTPKDLLTETLCKLEEEIGKQQKVIVAEKEKLAHLNQRRLSYEELLGNIVKEEKTKARLLEPNPNHLPESNLPKFPSNLIEGSQTSAKVYKLLTASHFMGSTELVELYKKEYKDDNFTKSKLYAALYNLQKKAAICFGNPKDLPADKIPQGTKGNTLYRKWSPVELKEKYTIPVIKKSPAIIGGAEETTSVVTQA